MSDIIQSFIRENLFQGSFETSPESNAQGAYAMLKLLQASKKILNYK